MGFVSFSQSTGYFRYDSIRFEKLGGNSEFILLNSTRNVTGGVLTNLGNGRTGFVMPSGGSGGLFGGNLGVGFRIYYPPSQGVRTLFNSTGFSWDSTSNANGLTGKVDSLVFSTKAGKQKGIDSLAALKQDLLVSGTNIKTINGTSLLGSGNISISASAAGNSHGVQVNRNGALSGVGDSLTFNANGLTIKNSIRLDNSTSTIGALYIGGNKWIHDYTPAGNSWNISIGNGAGSFNTNQNNKLNISIGEGAGAKWKSNGNIAIGYHAGFLHEAADTVQDIGNVFIGYESGGQATGGRNSVAVGINTLKNMTTGGYSNAAVGKGTLLACTTCGANSVIGPSVASGAVFTGEWNSITGADVMINATTATGNAVVGGMAMMDGTTSSENSLVGYFAGNHITTGSSNVMVGPRTGLATTTGNYNIFLGHGAGTPIGNTTGRLSFNYNPALTLGTATLIGDLTNKRIAINKTEDAALTYTLEVGGTLAAATVPFTASTKDTLVYWNPSTTQFERRLVASGGGSGTVTDFIFTDANGFDGTVSTSTSTPTLSLNSTVADTRVIYSTSGALTGSGQFTFTGQALQLASTNTTQATTSSIFSMGANSLTTGTAQYIASSTLTSGNLINLASTSTAKTGANTLLNIASSGANGSSSITNRGATISVTNTGTTSENRALELTASGATTNWAAYATAGNFRTVGAAGYYALNSAGTSGASFTYDNATTATIGTTGGVRLDLNAPSSNILSRVSFVVGAGIDFGNAVSLDVYKSASGTANIQNWRSSGGTVLANVNQSGRFFIGSSTSATALLHLDAGTTAASTAPLKFTSGTDLTSAEAGAFEYNGTRLAFSPSTTRKRVLLSNDAAPSNGQIPIGNGTDYTAANITSSGGTITVTNGSGTMNVDLSSTLFAEGDYTPTASNQSNITGTITVGNFHYIRNKNSVHVWGTASASITAANTATTFELTLPVASTFTNASDAVGSGAGAINNAVQHGVAVVGVTTTVLVSTVATTTGNRALYFDFNYIVK